MTGNTILLAGAANNIGSILQDGVTNITESEFQSTRKNMSTDKQPRKQEGYW
jgi:hypothetical protein